MRTLFLVSSIIVSIFVIVGAGLLLTPLGDRPLGMLFAVGKVEPVDFAEIELTDRPNQFLTCPPGLCGARAHAESPLFDVSVERLRARWREVVAGQPGVELLAEDRDGFGFEYVQRSPRFRFPDLITVRFITASPSQSTLAVYSRAIYGRKDFGVNRERIESWLDQLREGL